MKYIFILPFCLTVLIVSGQSFENIISSNRYIDCQDVSYNVVPIIEKLYAENQIDSIYLFLDYWESKCGLTEANSRLRNILDIKTFNFNQDSISKSLIEQLISFRRSLDTSDNALLYYPYNVLSNDLVLPKSSFNSLAQKISKSTYSNNLEKSLLLDFYSSQSPNFGNIKTASSESKLKQLHSEVYNETLRMSQFHIAFITGINQHYGNLSIFGMRPNFGVAIGGKKVRHNYDVILDFRAGPSSETYSFVYEDSLVSDNVWTGMYLGLEYTYDFIHSKKLDIGVSPGIGYDRITALTTENDYGEDAKFLSSFNRNVGLVFKYKYGKNGGYAGLHVRYNWTDFNNPRGTALDGEYLNIRLTIGSIFNPLRHTKLKNLE